MPATTRRRAASAHADATRASHEARADEDGSGGRGEAPLEPEPVESDGAYTDDEDADGLYTDDEGGADDEPHDLHAPWPSARAHPSPHPSSHPQPHPAEEEGGDSAASLAYPDDSVFWSGARDALLPPLRPGETCEHCVGVGFAEVGPCRLFVEVVGRATEAGGAEEFIASTELDVLP